jgi:uncharacterized protein GlcG (DUF336 family)
LATVFVGLAVALYASWLAGTEILGLSSTRAFTVAILVLGMAGCYTARSYFESIYGANGRNRAPLPYTVLVSVLGGVALVAAVVALIGGAGVGGGSALTVLVLSMIALWATATIRHQAMSQSSQLTPMH